MNALENRHEEYMPLDSCPHRIIQPELNDPICDLNLSEIKAEVPASKVQELNPLERNVKTPV
jgi:hypothetical protein